MRHAGTWTAESATKEISNILRVPSENRIRVLCRKGFRNPWEWSADDVNSMVSWLSEHNWSLPPGYEPASRIPKSMESWKRPEGISDNQRILLRRHGFSRYESWTYDEASEAIERLCDMGWEFPEAESYVPQRLAEETLP